MKTKIWPRNENNTQGYVLNLKHIYIFLSCLKDGRGFCGVALWVRSFGSKHWQLLQLSDSSRFILNIFLLLLEFWLLVTQDLPRVCAKLNPLMVEKMDGSLKYQWPCRGKEPMIEDWRKGHVKIANNHKSNHHYKTAAN